MQFPKWEEAADYPRRARRGQASGMNRCHVMAHPPKPSSPDHVFASDLAWRRHAIRAARTVLALSRATFSAA